MLKRFLICIFILSNSTFLYSQRNVPYSDDIKLANEYYTRGEIEKAKDLYEKIAEDPAKISHIHTNYLFLLLSTSDFQRADKYLKRIIKRFPTNLPYKLDYGMLLRSMEKSSQADDYFKEIIEEIKSSEFLVGHASNYFVTNRIPEYAEYTILKSRESLNNNNLYALHLANVYRIIGKREKMVREYLNYTTQNPSNIRYVKRNLQNLLTEPEDLESLEVLLYEYIQKDPDNIIYTDLLIWGNLQLKNFYAAFIQARAIDKKTKSGGEESLRIGMIALDNNDFTTAKKIFDYIIKEFPGTYNYVRAKMLLIQAYEMRVKNTFPISREEIQTVIEDYEKFIRELGTDRNTLEAYRNKALLHAFYLDELDTAIVLLNFVLQNPRSGEALQSKTKLDLGDIYLLDGQPWEATLLYSQVEKEQKETESGYEAKLKNARLRYFQGEFQLAQDHLDILKEATSRVIANDAMELSLLIKDNTAMDSTEEAMNNYAKIELLLFQNKKNEARNKIKSFYQKFPSHSLSDELYWIESNLELEEGNFEVAIDILNKIMSAYDYDILADDAYFLLGDIYEKHLKNKEKAADIYFDFLKKFPGSVYAAEARKRYRIIRGDFSNSSNESE